MWHPADGRISAVRDLGEYELQEVIAKGGMATVYKAYQPSLARVVAIKVLSAFWDPGSRPGSSARHR
ncbi:MAG: hypothetical protein ACRD0K_01800 [Egibacteraceae bacterium]